MTASLLRRPTASGYGEIVSVEPDGKAWKYVGFRVARLALGSKRLGQTGSDEVVLVLIEGTARVESGKDSWYVGKRSTPFQGLPEAMYLPPDRAYTIEAQTECEVAICSGTAGSRRFPARLLAPQERDAHTRGTGNAKRRVCDIMMDPDGASTLFLTEVITPPGHWSSFPPHKHDRDEPPVESALEEIYYYRAEPHAGFAFQRIYTPDGDLDETITAHDRDVVLVPRGYHVCAAAAGYSIYYLNVLAGPKHVYHMTFDPDHEWIKEGWTW